MVLQFLSLFCKNKGEKHQLQEKDIFLTTLKAQKTSASYNITQFQQLPLKYHMLGEMMNL